MLKQKKIFGIALSGIALIVLSMGACDASEYVELSEHYALKPISPLFGKKYNAVYFREEKGTRYKQIGTTEPSNWDKPFSGAALESLQISIVAVSLDGKSLLYRHNGKKNKKAGIYWYQIGKSEEKLYSEASLVRSWSKYDKPLPKNIMVLESSAWPSEEKWALNADDASLQPLALLGSTPLHLAAYHNNLKQIHAAIDQGAEINSENYWGFTPLEIAVKKGFDEVAIFLIEQGADYEHSVEGYLSAIELAVHLQRWSVIEAIRNVGGRLAPGLVYFSNMRSYTQLMRDNRTGYKAGDNPKMMQLILGNCVDPDSEDQVNKNHRLENANRQRANSNLGESNIIYRLLEKQYRQGTDGKLESLKLLLSCGFDPLVVDPFTQRTPLHLMVLDSVKLDIGWKWNAETREIIDLLTSNMKTLEQKDKFGVTALQQSWLNPREAGDFYKALYLLDAGADDSVEWLRGLMRKKKGRSIRQRVDEWCQANTSEYCPVPK